jgi:hypothetical protein
MILIGYEAMRAAVAAVLEDHVIARDDGRIYDYWAATEAACLRLGVNSASGAGNLIDGMIVDAVEERFGVALPDVRLTPERGRA